MSVEYFSSDICLIYPCTSSSLKPFAIPFKFLVITFATAVERTLASVLGYVTSFFSYNSCITASVSSGFILNLFVHSFCISARLNKSGGFSLDFVFFTSVIFAFFPSNEPINSFASFSFLKPLSLYSFGELYITDFSVTFHSALKALSSPNSPNYFIIWCFYKVSYFSFS